jgi:ATP-dependent DNA helicase RecQ
MSSESIPHIILKKYFGYDAFRPMQEEIINHVMGGKDCLVIMPTGGGKSICYQIPAIASQGTFIVLSPLIALMKDQVESLRANGIEAAFINSSMDAHEESEQLQKLEQGQLKLLYLSPEKLQSTMMYARLQNTKISGFAIDEAHCISVWGHDFREEYGKLGFIKKKWPDVPVIALTATADKISRRDIVEQLNLEEPKIFLSSFNRPNLSLQVRPGQQVYRQVKNIVERHKGESGIIYCLSRKSCEEVAMKLKLDGHKAAYYHAGMEARLRSQTQEDFIKDNIPIIVATIAFGMGIDKSNIRFVIHYNLPKNIEGYYQEIGRGGRDGLPCETVMFYSFRDVMILRDFAENSALKEIQLAKLKRIQQFAEAEVCRRKMLLSYFGEDLRDDCGNCDVCKNPPTTEDATMTVQMALSALKRLNENVGIGMLIDVLRGSQKAYIFENGYHEIKTFGVGKDISYVEWQHYILQMLHHGLIEIAYDQKHVLKVPEAGNEVLFNGRKIRLVKPALPGELHQPYVKPEPRKSKKEEFDEGLFEALRELRKQIADSKGVPPYVVFSDATLKEMAADHPINLTAMSLISGVGEFKLAAYGEVFISEIQKFMANSEFGNSVVKGKTYLETLRLLKDGKTINEIARARKIHETTVYSHLAYLVEKQLVSDIDNYITKEEMNQIEKAVKAIGATEALKPIYDFLHEKIDYGKIRLYISFRKNDPQKLKF